MEHNWDEKISHASLIYVYYKFHAKYFFVVIA